MPVFVEGAAEPVPSADIEVRDLFRIANRFGERAQRCCSPESPVRPVLVVEVRTPGAGEGGGAGFR